MKTFIISFIILASVTSLEAQVLHADFHCTGTGFDAGCGGFGDNSTAGMAAITGWVWDFGDGSFSFDQNIFGHCYDSIGNYTVCLEIIDFNGDSSKTCKQNYMVVDSLGTHCNFTSSITDLNYYQTHLILFPNPASDQLNIKIENENFLDFVIYDTYFRFIKSQGFNSSATVVLTTIPDGIYFYKVQNDKEVITRGKFIKK